MTRPKLPPEVEAYYAAGRRKLVAVTPNEDFSLTLEFDNGEKRLYDVAPSIQAGGVFAKLRRWEDFKRVRLNEAHCVAWDIDPNVDSSVVWENVIDLCPDSCYIYSARVQPAPTEPRPNSL